MRAWWQKDTVVRYLEKADCIVEQYANYTDPRTQLKVHLAQFLFADLIYNVWIYYLNLAQRSQDGG